MEFLWKLSEIRTPFLTVINRAVTICAEEYVILVLLCVLFWCVSKKTAYKMGFAYMASATTVQGLKVICRIERPWILDPGFKAVKSAVPAATGYSFPSGHTCAATSMYGAIAFLLKKVWKQILLFALIGGVMFSRMYLGVHTPADVLEGFSISIVLTAAICVFASKDQMNKSTRVVFFVILALATVLTAYVCIFTPKAEMSQDNRISIVVVYGIVLILAIAAYLFGNKIELTKKNKLIIAIVYAIYAIAALILCIVLENKGTIETKYAVDCAKTSGSTIGFVIGWYIETTYINFSVKTKKWWHQVLKVVIGAAVIMGLRLGIKGIATALFTEEPIAMAALRYFLMVIFGIGIYPIFIKKFCNKENS